MSNFSKFVGPTEEELVCGLCTDVSADDLPKSRKRQRKSRSIKSVESHQKFTAENLFKKKKEAQATLTTMAFKPCCSRNCLIKKFGKNGDPNFFDFTEAKKCFEYYYDYYKGKSKDEYNLWLFEEFQKTCYGLDEGRTCYFYNLFYLFSLLCIIIGFKL
jgi:hypothetical protein